ncbi:hypothetical protein DVW02_16305 [Clostridium botulinum]|nr:hypothetical protein [Clostridium botulinum]
MYGNIVCKPEDDKVMEYISSPEAAKKWGISERMVHKLCLENRIQYVVHFSHMGLTWTSLLLGDIHAENKGW